MILGRRAGRHRTRKDDQAASRERQERAYLAAAASTRAAKRLVTRFGGDHPSSADWRHFGRVAGFTNPKRERQLPSVDAAVCAATVCRCPDLNNRLLPAGASLSSRKPAVVTWASGSPIPEPEQLHFSFAEPESWLTRRKNTCAFSGIENCQGTTQILIA
jgi:hypothetical protein